MSRRARSPEGGDATESYRPDGREGLVRHYRSSRAWRYGARGVRILPCLGGTCPRLAFSRQHLGTGPGLGTQTIDDARRLALLRRSAKGKWIGAISLSEPTAGSDLAAVQTRAIRQDGYWLLSGTKRRAGFALAADFIEVLARTRDPMQG